MPRTKQPRKTRSIRETTEESDSLVRDFERQAAAAVYKIEADIQMQINSFANSVDIAFSRLPTEVRKLTLGEIAALNLSNYDNDEHDSNNPDVEGTNASSTLFSIPPTNVGKTRKKGTRVTAASDDGYATESTMTKSSHLSRFDSTKNSEKQAKNSRSRSHTSAAQERKGRTTRSSSRNRITKFNSDLGQENRNNLLKTSNQCPSAGKYTTPSAKNGQPCFSAVTPKVKPNTPIHILRRPKEGEMVLSMQGSPLLVSSDIHERMPNLNVRVNNGNVISLLPTVGLRLSHVPPLDEETMNQLKILQENLNTVIGNK